MADRSASRKKWREAHPLKYKEAQDEYYKKNRAKILKKSKLYRLRTKETRRWYHIMKTYGLTKEQWFDIYSAQSGRCYICLRDEEKIKRGRMKYLTVDHCHKSGKIRGLLCGHCNKNILPAFERDPSMAERMFEYLKKDINYGITPDHIKEIPKIL